MSRAAFFLTTIAMILLIPCFGQPVEKAYPKTLWTGNDSVTIKFSWSTKSYPYQVSKSDTSDMGTDGAKDLYATLYYNGKDSIRFDYNNLPYAQWHYIPFESPKGKTIFRLRFNGVHVKFPQEYIEENKGNVQIEIPEVYELANIIWTLSPTGQRAQDLYKHGPYYQEIQHYFKPWLNHPVFAKLDLPDSLYSKNYYDFRENSFAYNFENDKIIYKGPYYYVMGEDWESFNSLFRGTASTCRDFAKKSNYREFYKRHHDQYAKEIKRQYELLPVKNMWAWLEQQVPRIKYQSYKVVFSPLIGGSHSTQNFSTLNRKTMEWFGETVMFICGTARYDTMKILEKQKEGLMSGDRIHRDSLSQLHQPNDNPPPRSHRQYFF